MEKEKIEIKIPIDSILDNATASIAVVEGKEPIVAFVQLDFGLIKIKGITVKKRDFRRDGNEVMVLDMPAYRAGYSYIKSVFIADKNIYTEITQAVLRRVQEELDSIRKSPDYIDVDAIPF